MSVIEGAGARLIRRRRARWLRALRVREAVRRLLLVWRSPADQPAWARPTLLAVAGLSALAYAWGANGAHLEPFYGAAARSMSQSWHDFIFGSFDPLGTVTVDKLPGALWLQALSLRVFGFHIWASVFPQVLEGVLTILVLYRAVRRLAGPVAGMAAAVALAATPVTVELNRGNVSDSLLILLTVLAADATSAAIVTGRGRRLLLAGFWIGLAFQAKMLQAWLLLPALAIPYLLYAPGPRKARLKQVGLSLVLAVVVSLSWMSAVSLVPASQRPYVDGSRNDSLFSQVFLYNGYARLGTSEAHAVVGIPPPFAVALTRRVRKVNLAEAVAPAWNRLLSRPLARDWAWLLAAALAGTLLLLWDRRRKRLSDPVMACLVLWGNWLLILGASFSGGVYLNSYYLAALSPALAAICGLGVDLFWRRRHERAAAVVLAGVLAATAGFGTFLIAGAARIPGWVLPLCLALSVAGVVSALVTSRASSKRARSALALIGLACLGVFPAATSALIVSRQFGPFDLPYAAHPVFGGEPVSAIEARYEALVMFGRHGSFLATYTSALASTYVFYTGREMLPLGGYTGLFPTPTPHQLSHYLKTGQLIAIYAPDPREAHSPLLTWIHKHCTTGPAPLRRVLLIPYACLASG